MALKGRQALISQIRSRGFGSSDVSGALKWKDIPTYALEDFLKALRKRNPVVAVPVGKFLPARLNANGTVTFAVSAKDKSTKKLTAKNPPVVKNVAYGHTIGTGQARVFYPHRSSADYDPTQLKGAEGVRARAKKATAKKKKAKKVAKRKK